jgi:hypothetical protein
METEKLNNKVENFNITYAPTDILKIKILIYRDNLINAIESYIRYMKVAKNNPCYEIRTRFFSLFLYVKSAFEKDKTKEFGEQYCKDFLNDILHSDYEVLIMRFYELEDWLYKKELTKFDGKVKWDYSNIELSNKMNGF